jgi:hypothetical protein
MCQVLGPCDLGSAAFGVNRSGANMSSIEDWGWPCSIRAFVGARRTAPARSTAALMCSRYDRPRGRGAGPAGALTAPRVGCGSTDLGWPILLIAALTLRPRPRSRDRPFAGTPALKPQPPGAAGDLAAAPGTGQYDEPRAPAIPWIFPPVRGCSRKMNLPGSLVQVGFPESFSAFCGPFAVLIHHLFLLRFRRGSRGTTSEQGSTARRPCLDGIGAARGDRIAACRDRSDAACDARLR